MPGIRVLIKGLNKVIEFPSATALPDIEKAIKVNWSQVEEISGLPMDDVSRLARAEHLGFDTERVFTHESSSEGVIAEITNEGRFGGLFSLENDRAHYYNNVQDFLVKGDIADSDTLSRFAGGDFDGTKEWLEKEFGESITDDEAEAVIGMITTEDNLIIESDDAWDRMSDLYRSIDSGDFFAENQRLRGKLAGMSGAGGVNMADEFGESVLLLPGSKVKSIKSEFNPVNIDKKSLLSVAAATSLGAATLAPDQAQAQTSFIERMLSDKSIEGLPSGVAAAAPFIDQGKIPPQFRPDVGGLKGGNPSVPIALSQAAKVLDNLEVPVIGKPFEGVADYLRNFGFDDSNKERFKRAVFAALDVI